MFFVESDYTWFILAKKHKRTTRANMTVVEKKYKMICFWAVSGHTLSTSHQCVSQTNNNPWLSRGEGKMESQQHKSSSNKVWTCRIFASSVLTPSKHTQSSFFPEKLVQCELRRREDIIEFVLDSPLKKNCIYASRITRFTPAVNWKKSPEQKMKSERKYL